MKKGKVSVKAYHQDTTNYGQMGNKLPANILAKVQDEFMKEQSRRGSRYNSCSSTRKNSLNNTAVQKQALQKIMQQNKENKPTNNQNISINSSDSSRKAIKSTMRFFPNDFANVLSSCTDQMGKSQLTIKSDCITFISNKGGQQKSSQCNEPSVCYDMITINNNRSTNKVEYFPKQEETDGESSVQESPQLYQSSSQDQPGNESSVYSSQEGNDRVETVTRETDEDKVSKLLFLKTQKQNFFNVKPKASCPMNTEMSETNGQHKVAKFGTNLQQQNQQLLCQMEETQLQSTVDEEPQFNFERENLKDQQVMNQTFQPCREIGGLNDHSMYGQIIQMLISKISVLEAKLQTKTQENEEQKLVIQQCQIALAEQQQVRVKQSKKSQQKLSVQTSFDKMSFNGKPRNRRMNSTFY